MHEMWGKDFERGEGDVVPKALGYVRKFFRWCWEVDGDNVGEVIAGSLLILIAAAIGLLFFFGFCMTILAAFNHSWVWIFSWPFSGFIAIFVDVKIAKAIADLYDDFF